MKVKIIALFSALLVTSVTAHADYFGSPSGRSANPANEPQLSVEGSASLAPDYRNIGARINYAFNDKLTAYGDFGISDLGFFGSDGTSIGGGVFYHMPNITPEGSALGFLDAAIQGSFHIADLDFFDASAITALLLVSPKEPINASNGLTWYANAGLVRLSVEFDDRFFGSTTNNDIEPQIGGGIKMNLGPGTFYAGADLIDELIAGVGYRYGIK